MLKTLTENTVAKKIKMELFMMTRRL